MDETNEKAQPGHPGQRGYFDVMADLVWCVRQLNMAADYELVEAARAVCAAEGPDALGVAVGKLRGALATHDRGFTVLLDAMIALGEGTCAKGGE